MKRSDLFIIDIAFLLGSEAYILEDMVNSLSSRISSCLILYEEESEINELTKLVQNKEFVIDDIKTFEFRNDASDPEFEELFRNIDSAIQALHKRKVFLSHASEDEEFTMRLAHELRKKGIAVWLDKSSLKVGDSIVEKINQGIEESTFMILVISRDFINKPWCKREMSAAFHRQSSQKGFKILPIIIEDCDVPPLISDIMRADFRKSFDEGLKSLLDSIRAEDFLS